MKGPRDQYILNTAKYPPNLETENPPIILADFFVCAKIYMAVPRSLEATEENKGAGNSNKLCRCAISRVADPAGVNPDPELCRNTGVDPDPTKLGK